ASGFGDLRLQRLLTWPLACELLIEKLQGFREIGRVNLVEAGAEYGFGPRSQLEVGLAKLDESLSVLNPEDRPHPLESGDAGPAPKDGHPAAIHRHVAKPAEPEVEPGMFHDLDHLCQLVQFTAGRSGGDLVLQLGIRRVAQGSQVAVGTEGPLNVDP